MLFHQYGPCFRPRPGMKGKRTTFQTQVTLIDLPGSVISQACFMARISSARSVSFFTSKKSASLYSVTNLKIQ